MRQLTNLFAAVGVTLACALTAPTVMFAEPEAGTPPTRRAVEIRSYNLKPGSRTEFHRLASELAVPMLRRWKIDVVAYGPSPHDDVSYYLIRAYESIADRQRSEDAFYGSDEWRLGPRESILALIDSYTTVVLDLDDAAVESLRRPLAQAAALPPPAVAEVQLQALNHARVQAYVASERGSLSGLVDEDFRFTGVDGAWLDKPAFVALGGERPHGEAISYHDVRVRLFGEVGLVHALLVYLKPDGTLGNTRYTDAYRWDGAAWRLISAQLSGVADPTASALTREVAPAHAPWQGEDPTGDDEQVLRMLNARDGRWVCIAAHVTRHKLPS